jgi:glucokinase
MRSKEIVEKGLKNEDPIAVETLDIFAKIYGTEAGNFAIRTLCYGGIYLTGSLTGGIKEYLAKSQGFFV